MGGSAVAAAEAYLLAGRNDDAGWGYNVGDVSVVEATAAVVMALEWSGADRGESVRWLSAAQHADGGWGIAADDAESGWQTAWAVLALAAHAEASAAVDCGLAWLRGTKSLQVRSPDDPDRRDSVLDIDLSIQAWPWLPGQAGWVEPTALAMLALSRSGATTSDPRLAEAVDYLLDRRCRGGGWNFGNPYMFAPLPARAEPTAWAVMALSACAPDSVTTADVEVLRAENERDQGTMAAALTVLGLRAVGVSFEAEAESLQKAQADTGDWGGGCYCTALALLALGGGLR